jgi:hypothetical protein
MPQLGMEIRECKGTLQPFCSEKTHSQRYPLKKCYSFNQRGLDGTLSFTLVHLGPKCLVNLSYECCVNL